MYSSNMPVEGATKLAASCVAVQLGDPAAHFMRDAVLEAPEQAATLLNTTAVGDALSGTATSGKHQPFLAAKSAVVTPNL